MKKIIAAMAVSFLSIFLVSCITTSDKPKPKIDKTKLLDSHIMLGMAYLSKDQRDNALRAFSKALEVDKNSAEAHLGMALIHQINAEFEASEKSFQRALRSKKVKSRSEIEFSYARFLMDRERCSEALPYLEKVSKDLAYRRRVNAVYSLGQCADMMGNEERAVSAYQHALNLNDKFSPAAIELAHKKFDAGEYAEAKKFLDLYTNNSRQSARSLWLGIRIERVFGNKDKEASYALALKNLHPYSREYLEYKRLNEAGK